MTPGARVAAAIEVLDSHLQGVALEKALTTWGRKHRFAGSKDRAAIRDLVFMAVRRRKSSAAFGADANGRSWIMATLHQTGADLGALFSGQGHSPDPITDTENAYLTGLGPDEIDLQDWVFATLVGDYDEPQALEIANVLRDRAPTTLRVNSQKMDRSALQAALSREGIETRPNPCAETALTVETNPRRVAQSAPFLAGQCELQDAASQALCELVPLGGRILDYCAGGGGKALAIAARACCPVWAHDHDPKRMGDIPARAGRGGHLIHVITPEVLTGQGQFEAIVCDVPCSGSGAWRRAPESKWSLSPSDLADYVALQREVVGNAIQHLAPGGALTYITCSIFADENQNQRAWILENFPKFKVQAETQFLPNAQNDGLYGVTFTQ